MRHGASPSRTTTWRAATTVSAALAGLLAVTACGSVDNADNSGGSGGGSTTSSYYSPVGEYLNPPSTANADYAEMDKKVQELVAPCMREQGFDYEPFTYPMSTEAPSAYDDYGSRDWVVTYGYGISTMNVEGMPTSSGPDVTDPNQAIVDAMSESEREAYYVALYGGGGMVIDLPSPPGSSTAESSAAGSSAGESSAAVSTDPASTDPAATGAVDPASTEAVDPAASDPGASDGVSADGTLTAEIPIEGSDGVGGKPSMPSLGEQGCWGQAQAEVYGDQQGFDPGNQDQFQDMWDAYNTLYEDIRKDDRVVAAATEWIGCMSAVGYPDLVTVDDANMQANTKWSELNGWDMQPIEGGSGGFAVATSAEATSMSAPPSEKVAEFREYELKIALADFDCKDSSKYTELSESVRIDLEKAFVEDHKAELEQYRNQMNGGG